MAQEADTCARTPTHVRHPRTTHTLSPRVVTPWQRCGTVPAGRPLAPGTTRPEAQQSPRPPRSSGGCWLPGGMGRRWRGPPRAAPGTCRPCRRRPGASGPCPRATLPTRRRARQRRRGRRRALARCGGVGKGGSVWVAGQQRACAARAEHRQACLAARATAPTAVGQAHATDPLAPHSPAGRCSQEGRGRGAALLGWQWGRAQHVAARADPRRGTVRGAGGGCSGEGRGGRTVVCGLRRSWVRVAQGVGACRHTSAQAQARACTVSARGGGHAPRRQRTRAGHAGGKPPPTAHLHLRPSCPRRTPKPQHAPRPQRAAASTRAAQKLCRRMEGHNGNGREGGASLRIKSNRAARVIRAAQAARTGRWLRVNIGLGAAAPQNSRSGGQQRCDTLSRACKATSTLHSRRSAYPVGRLAAAGRNTLALLR